MSKSNLETIITKFENERLKIMSLCLTFSTMPKWYTESGRKRKDLLKCHKICYKILKETFSV